MDSREDTSPDVHTSMRQTRALTVPREKGGRTAHGLGDCMTANASLGSHTGIRFVTVRSWAPSGCVPVSLSLRTGHPDLSLSTGVVQSKVPCSKVLVCFPRSLIN
jgi:hypothetical protein